jgi:ribosomal protein S18 acetylase RimI-like enzyme
MHPTYAPKFDREIDTMGASTALVSDGVALRAMTAADLAAAHALTTELRWPHRAADWEQAFRHGEGFVAERDGQVIGTGLRWRWGPRHATIGLVVVAPACQGRRIGHRLMTALLEGLEDCSVLLHATSEGRGLYERLGFVRIGEVRQHQGNAQPSPLIALDAGWRLRPATEADLPALRALDAGARGMPRDALIDELFRDAEATVVLDHDDSARGFAILRRFGRGHAIGPVVAPDAEGAKALIAHLSGLNAGRFTRIDIDFDSGLAEWVESLGLLRVDAPTTMLRGPELVQREGTKLYAIVTQALG